ncbi:MAG: peptidylprolyl isomerase [Elusimicrobiales bacterium]|nr:peptidylprolyl isomerase [Elusimicrobiales bacterium]
MQYKTLTAAVFCAAVACAAYAREPKKTAAPSGEAKKMAQSAKTENAKLKPGLYAVITTAKGKITALLREDKAPKTVANFAGLAEGTKEWTDPKTQRRVKTRFYDGLTFMRVIPGFMIQGGDPLNNCNGGPGYSFEDEITPELTFNKPGILAMANSGPNTNGSQFFITDRPRGRMTELPSYLNGHYSIFGEVVEGGDVVSAIADTPANESDIALNPVVMTKVEILRVSKSGGPADKTTTAKAAAAK